MNTFTTITYLQSGNARQQRAYAVLTQYGILDKLQLYDPILVGTIPLAIDIESSDLDVICCFEDPTEFVKAVKDHFGGEENFVISEKSGKDAQAVVALFEVEQLVIEIFGQAIPTKKQVAYRHLLAEYHLLNEHGETLRQQVVELKRQGHKTEPAFALALGLTGDPYEELLKLEEGV